MNWLNSQIHAKKCQVKQSNSFTFINLVSISPSEASSWCLSTYLWHLDRAFSFGVDTLIALGMIGCITVSRSKLEAGLWSTHFSPPAECERLCIGWTGGTVWWSQGEKQKSGSYLHVVHFNRSDVSGEVGSLDGFSFLWKKMYCWK